MTIEIGYMNLTGLKCKPCEAGVPPLRSDELQGYKSDPDFNWEFVEDKKIVKDFKFDSYSRVIEFVNKVAFMAEGEGHHPVMHVYFSKVTVEFWTHAIDGLSENDFIMAAKLDEVYK